MERPPDIPTSPGVYRFSDEAGRVIYVGKAKNLRSRITSYFGAPGQLHARTLSMLNAAHAVDWVVVATEVEALTLEYAWIKEHDPRFNVKYRDDKSYPFVAVTVGEEYPRVGVTRESQRKGTKYFGPYAHAWAIRDTIDALQWVYPIRSCRNGVFRRAQQSGRPCLLGYIGKCSAPCVGRIAPEDYRALVEEFCAFLEGDPRPFVRDLEQQMAEAAADERFEEAARVRDRLDALRQALAQNVVELDTSTNADVIALVEEELEIGVQIFHVRHGRIQGERAFILEKDEPLSSGGYADRTLQHIYGSGELDTPREVLINVQPASKDAWTALLGERRGSQVDLRVPTRGDKRRLMDIVRANAQETLHRHQSSRARDLTTRSAALQELQEALDLPESPLRIECIDISTLQGTNTVGSLVVFEDALPRKQDYRSYIIRGATDDLSSIGEVVRRRFRPDGNEDTAVERSKYPPGLLVIDGARAQVQAATEALMECGITDVPVIGLAKRLEEVWRLDPNPVILSRKSEALYLLQRVRDEAHRRAIGHHRKRKRASVRRSALDGIPGLGAQRSQALIKHFGSVKRLTQASVAEIAEVPGIGPKMAERIVQNLRAGGEHASGSSDEL